VRTYSPPAKTGGAMRAVNDRPYILKVENILDKMRASPVDCCLPPAGWRQHIYFSALAEK